MYDTHSQRILCPERFWVVDPNPLRLFHGHILRGIALLDGWYRLCQATTSGWSPIYVNHQVNRQYDSFPLAFRSLELASRYQIPGQISCTVNHDYAFLASGDVNRLEAIHTPLPSFEQINGPRVRLWTYSDGTDIDGWISCQLDVPSDSTLVDIQGGRTPGVSVSLVEGSMAMRREQRKKIWDTHALFHFSLRDKTSFALRLARWTKKGLSPLETICSLTNKHLLLIPGEETIPVEVERWPSSHRISIYYARLPGRIEGIMFVRGAANSLTLELNEWKSGLAPAFSQIGEQCSRAHFTIFDNAPDAPEPLRYAFRALWLQAGWYPGAPVLCRLERQGDGIIAHPEEASLDEIFVQRLF